MSACRPPRAHCVPRCCATCRPSWCCSLLPPKFQPRWAHLELFLQNSPETPDWHEQSSRSQLNAGFCPSAMPHAPANTWEQWCSLQTANHQQQAHQCWASQSPRHSSPGQKIPNHQDRQRRHLVCRVHAEHAFAATKVLNL